MSQFRFEELEIWKEAIELADKLFDISDKIRKKTNLTHRDAFFQRNAFGRHEERQPDKTYKKNRICEERSDEAFSMAKRGYVYIATNQDNQVMPHV